MSQQLVRHSKLQKALRRKRRAVAGWAIAVVFLGFMLFAFLYTVITFVADQVNTWISGETLFTGAYDPGTNTFMDDLLIGGGIAIMVAFGGVIEIINLTQKRTSGEEVI